MQGGVCIKKLVLCCILLIFTFTSSVHALSWAYPFVVWNGNVYEVKAEMLVASDIGERIGEVKTTPNDMTGDYWGNASNAYPKGTKYFEINSLSNEIAIAVQVGEDQWHKAEYVQEAPFHWMDIFTKFFPIVLIGILIVIIARLRRKRIQGNEL